MQGIHQCLPQCKNTTLRNSLFQRKRHYFTGSPELPGGMQEHEPEFIIWIFTLTWKHLVLFLVLDWTDKLSCHRLFPASNLEVLLGNYYMFYNGGRRQKWLDHMKQYNTWSDVQTWLDQIKQYNTWAFCATKLSLCFIEVLHKKSSVLKVNGVQVSCL